jgi:hypothetical protein
MLAQQPKGQLQSRHKQRDKQNKHTKIKKKGNVYHVDNKNSTSEIAPIIMRWEQINLYTYTYT